jgi:hypothetical protein
MEVVQVATPGLPEVTVVVPHPVFVLHVTVPVAFCCCTPPLSNDVLRPLTSPYSPLIVAVNVTDWPKTEGFRLEVTTVAAVACVMLKLFVCGLLDPL